MFDITTLAPLCVIVDVSRSSAVLLDHRTTKLHTAPGKKQVNKLFFLSILKFRRNKSET